MKRQTLVLSAALTAVMLSGPLPAEEVKIEAMPAPGQVADPKPVLKTADAGTTADESQAAFVTKVGQALHASVDLAGLAQDKSSDPAVQDVSRRIAEEAARLLTGMTGLSTQGVPANLGPAYAAQVQSLGHVPSGDLFDDQYVPLQTSLTQQLTAMFQAESQSGSGPLKDLAARELATLQQDTTQMQALNKAPQ